MSALTIYADDNPQQVLLETAAGDEIAAALAEIGVRFERWKAECEITPQMSPDEILAAYAGEIERLKRDEGYVTVDVIGMLPDHPQKDEFRQKFLAEHTHSEDEVRFFVEGEGLFCLHQDGKVFQVRCCRDDLISVPANITHWFDMGPAPRFTAIRLFNNPEGWVANFTGSDIAERFPKFG
ncbi:acireductone dioxygenase [Marinobacterium nitratireducens]|uniref:Acireductone dioxygenase n=1 Tax=Marinobacterium nitratireducens TaxID=518897 RepID=A0A917ZBD8_9GAMM|nr:cupin [Marinobacterium nitratireducens]GGO79673.1 acireductone dioxygenase [Marinobacterium nitratireducens]